MKRIKIIESDSGLFVFKREEVCDDIILNRESNNENKKISDLHGDIKQYLTISIVINNQVLYFDYDDFKSTFKCTFFEFQYLVKEWLNRNNIQNGKWVRANIFISE